MRVVQQVEVKTRTKGVGTHQAFQAEVVPKETLSGKALYARLAERSNLTPSMAMIYIHYRPTRTTANSMTPHKTPLTIESVSYLLFA